MVGPSTYECKRATVEPWGLKNPALKAKVQVVELLSSLSAMDNRIHHEQDLVGLMWILSKLGAPRVSKQRIRIATPPWLAQTNLGGDWKQTILALPRHCFKSSCWSTTPRGSMIWKRHEVESFPIVKLSYIRVF